MTRTTHRRSRRLATAAAALTIGLGAGLTGCAKDAEPAPPASSTASEPPSDTTSSSTPSDTATPQSQTIDVSVSGDTVVPSGERVDAKVGEEIVLHVTADAPGEIHVHSTPEQEFTYEAGTTDLPLTIDQPGLVDVESHTHDLVIVQLEVR
ncbi:hypothetical protein [Nocardioides sp.]|uniref:hypothetical protein n=1 Tax=Nocardioides sp. TaxID=35761 RepID=UPI00286E5E61|nr:hypothetical protein [Nocardioides sp.]